MSSSSNRSRIGGRARARRVGLRARCYCEDPVGKWTTWSTKNSGRRFIGTRTKSASTLSRSILHFQTSGIKTCFWNFILLIRKPSVRNLKIMWNNHLWKLKYVCMVKENVDFL
ncbi:hypothetical protein LXL04_023868 [Taraxacum kok-saghyz]